MLDLSAAFDTIDHNILLQTLHSNAGISGLAFRWFSSYLKDRTQQVQVLGTRSEKSRLSFGVPQGSCLGPVLFTIYVASLFQIINHYLPEAHGYADDHQLYLAFKPDSLASQDSAVQAIEAFIKDVPHWMLSNRLKINDSKTEFPILGSRHQLQKVKIAGVLVGEKQILPVTSVRNLGVIFDSNLSMEKHVLKICSAAYFHLHNIRRVWKYLTQDTVCSIVHPFISSHIDYCNTLLNGLPACLVGKLQRVQNAAARLTLKIGKFDHVSPALIQLHWLPVRFRIKFKVLLLVFKAIHKMSPQYITEMCVRTMNDRYCLRSNNAVTLTVPRFKCITFGGRAFAASAPYQWNTLPDRLRSCNDLETFKRQLKTYLFTQFVSEGL